MKKFLLLVLVLTWFSVKGIGQGDYEVRLTDYSCYSCNITAICCNGAILNMEDTFLKTWTSYYGNEIVKIEISVSNTEKYYIDNLKYPCMNETRNVNGGNYTVTIKPKELKLSYSSGVDYLLPNDKIISFQTNYSYTGCVSKQSNNFTWEFKINDTWYIFKNSSGGVTTTGDMLIGALKASTYNSGKDDLVNFSTVFRDNFTIPVRVSMSTDCGTIISDTLTLHLRQSAPKIKDIVRINPTCYGSADGKAIVYFDRALFQDESLDVMHDLEKTYVDDLSDSCIVDTLVAGKLYNITLSGKFPYISDCSYNCPVTNTLDADHTATVTLTNPTEIKVNSMVPTDVLCYGGSDGKIAINSVSGGTSPYHAIYTKDNSSNTTSTFTSSTTIAGLYSGDYEVKIRDENSCFPGNNYDADDEPIYSRTIGQPTELQLSIANKTHPLGFERTDGFIELSYSGGTSGYKFYKNDVEITLPASHIVDNLGDGTYVFKIVDNHGCYKTATGVLIQPPKLEVNINTKQAIDCFGNTGELVALATGGVPKNLSGVRYDYAWEEWVSNAWSDMFVPDSILTNVYIGKYRVTVTDKNGISTTSAEFTLSQPAKLEIDNFVYTDVTCKDFKNGTAEVFVKGGTSPYNYTWTFTDISNIPKILSSTNNKVGSLDVGNISVHVVDKNGCTTDDASDEIVEPELLELDNDDDIVITEPNPIGSSKGKIKVTASGGTPAYFYNWNYNGTTGDLLADIPARDDPYKVTVTDANGCFLSRDIYVVHSPMIVTIVVDDTISCNGNSDGKLRANVIGGRQSGRVFEWHKYIDDADVVVGGNSPILSNQSEGTYYVKVSDVVIPVFYDDDAENVHEASPEDLKEPDILEITYSTTALSPNNADGKIKLTNVKGGNKGYKYQWNYNNVQVDSLTNIPARDDPYTVTVTDRKGCSLTRDIYLLYQMSVKIAVDSILCYGGTGRLKAKVIGGIKKGRKFEWKNEDTGETFIGSDSIWSEQYKSTYSVYVTDTLVADNEDFFESNDINFDLEEPDELIVISDSIVPSELYISDGQIELAVEGGTEPYSYQWAYHIDSTRNVLTNLPARDEPYTVTVTDKNACQVVLNPHVLYYPIEVTIEETHIILCNRGNEGELTAHATGGMSAGRKYSWYKNDAFLTESNDSILHNVDVGSYWVRVTDIYGEYGEAYQHDIEEPEFYLTLKHKMISPTTLTGTDGALELTVTGGVPGYSYLWDGDGTTDSVLTGLSASNDPYRVIVTDTRGCVKELSAHVAYYPVNVDISVEHEITCNGHADGRLKAVLTGGVIPYSSYTWYEYYGDIPKIIQGEVSDVLQTKAGKYKVEAKDVYDSVAMSADFVLSQPDLLSATDSITLPTAYNSSDGAIKLKVKGGTPPYSYEWEYGNATINPLVGLPANDNPYKVTVTDANQCSLELLPRIIYPLELELSIADSISCYQYSDGKLKAKVVGGVGTNYTYEWFEILNGTTTLLPELTSELSNLRNGTYRIKVTDIENNSDSADIEFISPEPIQIDSLILTPTSVPTASDGAIELILSGGTPGYTYFWDYDNSTTAILSGIPSSETLYEVTVTDRRNCANIFHTRLINPVVVVAEIVDSVSCYDSQDGRIKASAIGSLNPDYLYQWYSIVKDIEEVIPAATSDELGNIGAGRYKVIATGSDNMTDESYITITRPEILKVKYDINLPSAYDASDGVIHLSASGGTPPYSYTWKYDDNETASSLTNIPVNDNPYEVTVTDRKGCYQTVYPRLIYPIEIQITTDQVISCADRTDGKLSAVATGGVGTNYSYQWYKIENSIYIPAGNDNELPDIGEGDYQVKVTDIENNYKTSNVRLVSPDSLYADYTIYMPSAYNASDGRIKLDIKGGVPSYSYAWQYDATVKTAMLTNIPPNDNPYIVTVTDRNGCSTTLEPRIIYPMEVRVFAADSISCFGRTDGKLDVIATGGVGTNYSYQWYKIEDNISTPKGTGKQLPNIGAGTYQVKVTDIEDNFIYSDMLIFNEPALLGVKYTKRDLKCKFDTDGFVQLSVEGGIKPYAYSWSNNVGTARNSSLPENKYTYLVTDRRGCTFGEQVEITSPDELIVSIAFIPPKAFNYSDASIWVTASGGTPPYRYAWKELSARTYLVSKIPHGTYTAVVTDANGCVKEISEVIPNPPLLEAFIEITDSISCNGRNDGKLTVTSQGGVGEHSYTWYDANNKVISSRKSIENLVPGKYKVKVRDDNDIEAYSAVTDLIEPDVLKVSTRANSIVCNGDTDGWAEATATGGTYPYAYSWTTGANTARAEGLRDDRYFVFITDHHGCVVKGTAEVTVPGGLIVDTVISQPSCQNSSDGSLNFTISGGVAPYTYSWDDGTKDRLRNNLPAGIYGLTVSGANGCFKHLNIELINPEPLTIDLGKDLILCKGQQIDIDATINISGLSGVEYTWYRNGELFARTPVITVSQQGTYKINVSTRNGCSGSDEINITVRDYEISADFTVATKAVRREITKLVNLSYPYPDKSEWIVPEDDYIEVVSVTDEYIEIIFRENDSYTIGLRTFVGDCEMVIYKQIDVLDRYDVPEYEPEKTAFLKSFIAYPNPSNGQFTVRIELGEQADVKLRLVDITGSLVDEREAKGSDRYELYYNINAGQGVYLLQLITDKANTALKLIKN